MTYQEQSRMNEEYPYLDITDVHMCMFSYIQLFASPWPVACQTPLSMRFYRQEQWGWVVISFSGGSCHLRDKTCVSWVFLNWQADALPLAPLGKPDITMYHHLFIHPPVDGHLACFQFRAAMNKAATNVHVWVFVWTCIFISWVNT